MLADLITQAGGKFIVQKTAYRFSYNNNHVCIEGLFDYDHEKYQYIWHVVMQVNAEDGGNRTFFLAQFREPTALDNVLSES